MEVASLGLRVDGTANIDSATQSLGRFTKSGQDAERSTDSLSKGSQKSSKSLADVARESDRASSGFDRLSRAARTAIGVIGTALGTREIIAYADAWQNAENQLRIVTESTGQLADVQRRLVDTAIETRSNFSATANLYARLARSTTELGLSQADLIGLTTTINQSFAVSGATAEEASAAITQLSQGLASGALRGDEFNSVAEQAPGILRAVADSLNMGIGELRDFAATGGITAEIIVNALQGASDTIARDFSGSVATFGQQMEIANTQMTQFVGENSNIRSVIDGLGRSIAGATSAINDHSDAFNAVTGAVVGAATAYYGYATAVGVANAATAIFMRLIRVNPLILAAGAISSIAGAMYAARDATVQFGDTQATLADWMQGTWTTLSNLFKTQFTGAVDTAADAFGPLGQKVGEVASYLWNTFEALLGNIVDAAKLTANGIIAYFLTIRDTMGIVAGAIRDQFTNAFDNTLNIAAAFWDGIKSIFSGDIDFSAFRAAVSEGIINPLADAGGEIAESFAKNFSADHLGDSIQFFVEEIESFGDSVARNVRIANTEFRTLDDWFLTAPESISKIPPELEEVGKKAKESATSVSRLDESVNSLLNRLDPVRARTQAYAQGVSLLNTALATGTLNFGDYQRGMVALQEELYAVEEATDKATDEMAKQWEQRMERMDAAGVDMWRSFLTGSEDALSSFKNLAINTLAEVIHAYTTQKITASLGINLSGAGGSSGGGVGGLISSGRSLLGLGSSAQTAGAALGGVSGGLSSAAITSANQVVSGGLMSSITSGISAAMPWLAGGFAVDNILGLGITDGITKAISGLFGSSPTPFSGRFGTRSSADPGTFEHQDSDSERFYAESALGAAGFLDEGTERLQRAGTGTKEWAEELAVATAEIDNMTAALAPTAGELEKMRSIVQGLETSSRSAADIIEFALNERPRAALEALEGAFGEFVRSIDGGIEQVLQQAQLGQQAHTLLANSMQRLNLQFDTTTASSYQAAAQLAEYAGGLDNLSAVNDAYYQAAFTETERLSHAQEDLAASLRGITSDIPQTIGELRQLVEAQDSNTEAGAKLAYELMSLAPALLETSSAVRQAITEIYQSSLGRAPDAAGFDYWVNQISSGSISLEDALHNISNSTEAAEKAIKDSSGQIEDSSDSIERATRGGSSGGGPADESLSRQAEERAQYEQQLTNYLNDVVSTNNSILSAISSARDEFISSASGSLDTAQNELRRMLGSVIDLNSLERSLGVARNANAGSFSTFEEMNRYQGRTAIILEQLEEEASKEISIAERQLRALESIDEKLIAAGGSAEIPGFASGGYHSGGLRIVGEDGPEIERTGPSRIISNHKLRGMMGGKDDSLEELKKMNSRLERIESYNKDSRKYQRAISLQNDRIVNSETGE